jgi:hypothetical protein
VWTAGLECVHAGEIRNRLEQVGKPIGTYVLIAGQALARVYFSDRECAGVSESEGAALGGLGKGVIEDGDFQK